MKLFSIIIYRWKEDNPVQLSAHLDLSDFNFFQRTAIREYVIFHSRLISGRTRLGTRQSVEFEQNLGRCYVYVHPCGLAGAVLCDREYPMRVAFGLLTQILRDFQEKFVGQWESIETDSKFDFTQGDEFLVKYQNPEEADKLMKVQRELDEVKDVMLQNIEDILKRGETLDTLMEKSNDLSQTSHQFYRQAKKNNQCCGLY